MPNHSIKKKRIQQNNVTIDEKHSQLLDEFRTIETETVPNMESEKAELKEKLKNLREDDIDARMEIKDQIRDLTAEIKHLKIKKNNYLLENAQYVFNYFEEKKNPTKQCDN